MQIQTNEHGDPILTQMSEEGFVDMTFRISALSEESNWRRFLLSASHNGRLVGMHVSIIVGVQGGFDANMGLVKDRVYRKGVIFRRSGPESDRLIEAIAELYGLEVATKRMVDEETFTAIALQQGEVHMAKEPVRLKLFGRDGDPFVEDDYYESFFNTDFPNGLVFWNEKDPDYREPLLRALTS